MSERPKRESTRRTFEVNRLLQFFQDQNVINEDQYSRLYVRTTTFPALSNRLAALREEGKTRIRDVLADPQTGDFIRSLFESYNLTNAESGMSSRIDTTNFSGLLTGLRSIPAADEPLVNDNPDIPVDEKKAEEKQREEKEPATGEPLTTVNIDDFVNNANAAFDTTNRKDVLQKLKEFKEIKSVWRPAVANLIMGRDLTTAQISYLAKAGEDTVQNVVMNINSNLDIARRISNLFNPRNPETPPKKEPKTPPSSGESTDDPEKPNKTETAPDEKKEQVLLDNVIEEEAKLGRELTQDEIEGLMILSGVSVASALGASFLEKYFPISQPPQTPQPQQPQQPPPRNPPRAPPSAPQRDPPASGAGAGAEPPSPAPAPAQEPKQRRPPENVLPPFQKQPPPTNTIFVEKELELKAADLPTLRPEFIVSDGSEIDDTPSETAMDNRIFKEYPKQKFENETKETYLYKIAEKDGKRYKVFYKMPRKIPFTQYGGRTYRQMPNSDPGNPFFAYQVIPDENVLIEYPQDNIQLPPQKLPAKQYKHYYPTQELGKSPFDKYKGTNYIHFGEEQKSRPLGTNEYGTFAESFYNRNFIDKFF